MGFHRIERDHEFLRDVLVGATSRQQAQHRLASLRTPPNLVQCRRVEREKRDRVLDIARSIKVWVVSELRAQKPIRGIKG